MFAGCGFALSEEKKGYREQNASQHLSDSCMVFVKGVPSDARHDQTEQKEKYLFQSSPSLVKIRGCTCTVALFSACIKEIY